MKLALQQTNDRRVRGTLLRIGARYVRNREIEKYEQEMARSEER